jgi:2-phospho-L-lactate/phosphoenolpyruvate guanylyltransferase
MSIWAIIPAKPFALGKSRLSTILSLSEREALNRILFGRVFNSARQTLGAERTIVVTADTDLAAQIKQWSSHAVLEITSGDLNAALAQASRYATERGASAILVLPSDLVDITTEDVAALRNALGPPPSCTIAPDTSGQGTNALALAPPTADFFRFGPRSFAEHMELAAARGMTTQVVHRPGLAYDLDTPEAYYRFVSRQGARLRRDEERVSS